MKHQPDLLLAKTQLRLVNEHDVPEPHLDATSKFLACVLTLLVVGMLLSYVMGKE